MNDKSKQDTLFVTSLEKGMRVLHAFGEEHTELSLAEISRITGLEKSAAQRFTNTLHKLGLLKKSETTKRFRPAPKMLEFAYSYLWSDPLIRLATPKLIDLSKSIDGTVNMSILDGTDIVNVVRLPGRRSNFAASIVGRRVPALNTPSGRSMLAALPEEQWRHCVETWPIKKFTPHTTQDRKKILQLVENAYKNGFAQSYSELVANEAGLAAPILGSDGMPLAAVYCSASAFTYSAEQMRHEMLPLLMETVSSLHSGRLP